MFLTIAFTAILVLPFVMVTSLVHAAQPQLVISIPSSADEETYFNIMISADGQLIDNAQITFLGKTSLSSSNGTSLLAPQVDHDTSYPITVTKEGYQAAEATILVKNVGGEQRLTLLAPSTVNESALFIVTVTNLNGDPVEGVVVALYNFSSLTDAQGTIQVIAPEVDSDTTYLLTADKLGYVSAQQTILVKNNAEGVQTTLNGRVTSEQGLPLDKAVVSIRLRIDQTTNNVISLWKSVLTNPVGEYALTVVLSGTVELKTEKVGYETTLKTLTIAPGETLTVNFTLPVLSIVPSENRTLIDNAIQNGNVGAEVSFQQTGGSSYASDIQVYTDVSLTPVVVDQKEISLIVGSEQHTGGKTIAFYLDPTAFHFGDTIQVEYDHQKIPMADDLKDVLNPDDDGLSAEYLIIPGAKITEIFISVPHFSDHTITIASFIEGIGTVTAIALFIAIFSILGIIYIAPFFLARKSK